MAYGRMLGAWPWDMFSNTVMGSSLAEPGMFGVDRAWMGGSGLSAPSSAVGMGNDRMVGSFISVSERCHDTGRAGRGRLGWHTRGRGWSLSRCRASGNGPEALEDAYLPLFPLRGSGLQDTQLVLEDHCGGTKDDHVGACLYDSELCRPRQGRKCTLHQFLLHGVQQELPK